MLLSLKSKIKYLIESLQVLNCFEERIDNSFVHFIKRTSLKRYAFNYSRKYVSILKK